MCRLVIARCFRLRLPIPLFRLSLVTTNCSALDSSKPLNNIALMIILYRFTQRGIATIAFFLVLSCITIWMMPFFIIDALHAQGSLFENLSRFSALGYIFTPVSLVIFALSYTLHIKWLKYFFFWVFLLSPPIVFLYLSWSADAISVHSFAKAVHYPWGFETPIGPYFYLYVLWSEVLMWFSVVLFTKHYQATHEFIKRRQAYFMLLAVLVPLVIGTVTNGILPLFNIYVLPAAMTLSSIMSPIVVFAIFKYGLFEVTPHAILSSIHHAIITVDNKGKILHLNKVSEKVLGVNAASATGGNIENMLIVHNSENSKDNQLIYLLKQVLHKGKVVTSDLSTIMNSRRRVVPFTLSIAPVYTQNAVIGANIILRDIRRERAREKYKDDFINVLSHELKTPISSIKAYNQLLLKQVTDPGDKKRHYVMKIDEQLDRLARLIRDFFELSRVQTGKLQLKMEYVRIDPFIREIVDMLSITYKDRLLRIEGSCDRVVFIDKDRITQVVINLIANAFKFSPLQSVVLVLLSSDEKKVTVGIRDYGRGIEKEYHKKIFDQFFQIETVPQKNTGLGIGLYVASYIIKIHRGKIWVDSKPGKGSTFYFSLPTNGYN